MLLTRAMRSAISLGVSLNGHGLIERKMRSPVPAERHLHYRGQLDHRHVAAARLDPVAVLASFPSGCARPRGMKLAERYAEGAILI
jgi:hypothetical protein